jgi:hypothetical protein
LINRRQFLTPRSDQNGPIRQYDPFWYFPDTPRSRPNEFTVESAFPYLMYVHQEYIENPRYGEDKGNLTGNLRVAVRRWIERQITGDVIWWEEDCSFHRVYAASPSYADGKKRYSSHIQHGYYVFAFEEMHEATGFRMQFKHVVTEMAKYPPGGEPSEGDNDFKNSWEAREITGYDLNGMF